MNKFNILPKDVLGRNTPTNYMVMKLCYQINKLSSHVLLQKNIQTNEMQNTATMLECLKKSPHEGDVHLHHGTQRLCAERKTSVRWLRCLDVIEKPGFIYTDFYTEALSGDREQIPNFNLCNNWL